MDITVEAKKKTNTLYVALTNSSLWITGNQTPSSLSNPPPSSKQLVLLGYAIFSLTSQPPVPLRLLKLCVDPMHRRRGVALALLREKLRLTPGSCRLHVDVDRTGARALYAKAGFREVEVVKDYYELGRDAVIMERELQS